MFVGTVFFEILILEGIRKPVGREAMRVLIVFLAKAMFYIAWQRRGPRSRDDGLCCRVTGRDEGSGNATPKPASTRLLKTTIS